MAKEVKSSGRHKKCRRCGLVWQKCYCPDFEPQEDTDGKK